MTKMIRISDENYEKLKQYAKSKNRSISNAGDYIIEQMLTLKTGPSAKTKKIMDLPK